MTTFTNTHGFNFNFKLKNIQIEDITEAVLIIHTPTGNKLQRQLEILKDSVLYSTEENDLKYQGTYKFQVKVYTKDNFKGYSEIYYLQVKETLDE